MAEYDVTGAGVVVTGAAGGIGAALAAMLAGRGARVVVNDVDADRLRSTAAAINATAVAGDAAGADGVADLVSSATAQLGRIDLWFANAGIDTGGADEDADWDRIWQVNVMAHVRAARLLLPQWLDRPDGAGGTFVATASAAGLLTMLGSAPYSVTKHAALAHAQWLAATYAHRGLRVHAICPQGVRTAMYDAAGPVASLLSRDPVLPPEEVAEATWRAMAAGRFLVLPHPQVADYARARVADPDAWLGAMNHLQRRLDEA